ncbi:lipoprotein insertase outer membrane protein LolB [Thiohalorhabdus methylotrophus]|uniref:Outer-membrane lipoprotein LolB n=1 Tax=Thiohalorhabdus methylotrophus TaxID=3242694 RepID=A0ABV4TQ81_9GAMM
MRQTLPGFLLVLLLLSGCAGLGPQPAEDREAAVAAYRERAGILSKLEQWRLMGRVSVRGPQESGQVRVRWTGDARGGHIQVRNPFGQTVMEVRRGGQGLRVRNARGEVYRGWRARAVLRRQLGWQVPFGPMARWALGLARGKRIPETLDDRGRPLTLKSGPWRVTYGEYRKVDGVWLPVDLRVTREDVELHLRVDQWHLQQDADPAKGRSA